VAARPSISSALLPTGPSPPQITKPFDRLVNRSIFEALARSINAALTTILAIGVLTGGYSSILSACPVLVDRSFWIPQETSRLPA